MHVVVGREQDRPLQAAQVLQSTGSAAIEDGQQQLSERLLQSDADGAHHRIERPAEDALLPPGTRRSVDHRLELGERGVGIQLRVVYVGAQLLFDQAQELDLAQGVQPQVGGDAGVRPNIGWVHTLHARNEMLDGRLGWARVAGSVRRRPSRGRLPITQPFEQDRLLDLERRGPRQVLLWPDGKAADLLVRRELRVGRPDHVRSFARIAKQQDGVDLGLAGGVLKAHDRRVVDARVARERVLDVLRVDLGPVR